MGDGFVDGVPGIFQKLIIDAPVVQRQRRDLDQVNQLTRLDQAVGVRTRLDGSNRFCHVPYPSILTFVLDIG